MLRNFEQQLPPTFQLSKTQNLSLSFYLKFKEVWLFYNITLKSYQNKNILAGLAMKSLISIFLQTDDAVDVTSRHFRRCHVTSRPRTLLCIDVVGLCRRRRRCGHVLTSSRQHHEHLPEINIRKVSYVHRIYFEIVFFPKTDKFKSAFKLLLTSPGRKLWPILVLLYFQVKLI